MTRPPSIILFERFYLSAVVIGLINTAIHWSSTMARLDARGVTQMTGPWLLPLSTAIGFVIPLLLWYSITRRQSSIAKWIVTVFLVLTILSLGFSILGKTLPLDLPSLALGMIGLVLTALAVAMLFRPDSDRWFART